MPGCKSPTTTTTTQELCDIGLIYPTSLSLNFISCKMVMIVPSDLFKKILFSPCRVAYGILVPSPGIEPAPPALAAPSLNLWTAREAPWVF